MTLISLTGFLRFKGELLLLRFSGILTFWKDDDCKTTGGCLVAPHEMPDMAPVGILEFSYRSNSARSSRSSSVMYELAPLLLLPYGERFGEVEESTSRLGQEGYAQLAEGLQIGPIGAAGEREDVEEVVDGGESSDFRGICMGFANANRSDGMEDVDDEGDNELLLYSGNILSFEKMIRVGSKVTSSLLSKRKT